MATDGPFRGDAAGAMAGVAAALAGARQELETRLRQRLEALFASMDLVRREEFEVVRDMAVLARQENERLQVRIAALEAGGQDTGRKPPRPAAKRGRKRVKAPPAEDAP